MDGIICAVINQNNNIFWYVKKNYNFDHMNINEFFNNNKF